jgi:polyisoprenyl-phosphate glycosyltransferase
MDRPARSESHQPSSATKHLGPSSAVRYDVFVSLVVPIADDAEIVEDVVHDVSAVLKENYKNYELLLVDDGSTDHTKQIFEELRTEVDYLRYFRFARKFGLEVAIACGLDNAIGDVVVVMRPECDPPDLIPKFVSLAQSCRGIVVGTRNLLKTRSMAYKLAYDTYYRICTYVLERPQIYCSTHYMALTRTAINSVLKIKSSYRYLRVTSMYAGYQVIKCEYEPIRRRKTERHRKPMVVLDDCASMIVSNSLRPLRQAGAIAVLSGFFNLAYIGFVILVRIFYKNVQPGWATLSIQTTTMFAFIFLILGVICEYLARALEEVKVRPLYVVEDELQSSVMVTSEEVRNVVYSESKTEGPIGDS